MHRIDTSGSVNGEFQDGNPAIGQLATLLAAAWFNDVQGNICHAIEEAGLVLEKGDYEQLYQAIVAIATGAAGDGSGGVPTTRQILTAGLASGGGDLVADRTITVPKASTAEVTAGVRDDVAVTPLGLTGLAGLLGAGGGGGGGGGGVSGTTAIYRIGDIVHQVFTANITRHHESVVALPMAFPNQIFAAFVNVPGSWPGFGVFDGESNVKTLGLTHISVWADHLWWGPGSNTTAQFLAIGR